MALTKKPVKGMKDILPAEMAIRNYVMGLIRETYESFGFTQIETPCMEHIENLTSKQGGENEKLIFKILKRGEKLNLATASSEEDLVDGGMRYDLTVPLARYYSNHSKRSSNHQRNPNIKNVMFILLESFLSAPIDLEVDGKEITPFLNSLKRDSSVYYNGNMISDIGCGESGDGQFIYMTGLLPLKNKMTVGQVKDNTLPAFPIILKENLGIN